MAVDLDMIIGCDAATLPSCKDVWLVRQFGQLELIDLSEEFGAAGAKTAHLAGVEFDDKHANGGIEFRQGKEAVIAQTRQDPALRDLDCDLNLCLVLRASRPRREDRGAVMARHLGVGPVETGIVAIGVGNGGLEIIADHELRHAAQKPEQIGMQGDPVGQALARASLGVGVVRGSHRRDEQLHGVCFAGDGIKNVDGVAGEIDEHLLPTDVGLTHRRRARFFQASKVVQNHV